MEYFTSDTHFAHKNIVKNCGRPVLQENHDEWLISNINDTVGINDKVYCTGDFSFDHKIPALVELLKQLNGIWWFVPGNHDNAKNLASACDEIYKTTGKDFRVLEPIHDIKVNGNKIVLCHFPIEVWNRRQYGSYHFHGHLHGTTHHHDYGVVTKVPKRFDIGVDNHPEYRPFSYDEIMEILK